MSSKFSDKCKKRFRRRKGHAWEILEDQPQFIGRTRLLSTSTQFKFGLIGVKCRVEGGRFNQFKKFENHKSYVDSRCQILISGCKVFCLFQQIFVCEKVRK